MDNTTAMLMGVALVVVVCALAWLFSRNQRTSDLRHRFGPEYDRMVHESGSTRRAERELAHRAERVDHLAIRPLDPERRRVFRERWQTQQSRFVDQPKAAIDDADHLVEEVMMERGYPIAEFDQRAADISVDHPKVVEKYRAAHAIALRERSGLASTEDLRQAMIYYRDLFMDLLEDPMPRGFASR